MERTTVTPLTAAQLGLLSAEFRRLGYEGRGERSARLFVASQELGLEEPLASFSDLTAGQAGVLLGRLRLGEIPPVDAGAALWAARSSTHEGVAVVAPMAAAERARKYPAAAQIGQPSADFKRPVRVRGTRARPVNPEEIAEMAARIREFIGSAKAAVVLAAFFSARPPERRSGLVLAIAILTSARQRTAPAA